MKRLVFVNGTMGIGKTTVCREVQKLIPANVFLDGDWCWMAKPFIVTEETKQMSLKNIAFLLNSFLACSAYETVLFCWVMDSRELLHEVLSRLDINGTQVSVFTLTATAETVRERVEKDIRAGLRTQGDAERSIERIERYRDMETEKILTDGRTPAEIACELVKRLEKRKHPGKRMLTGK